MPKLRSWKPRRLPWQTQTQLARPFVIGPRKLVIGLQRSDAEDPWIVFAVETSAAVFEEILDAHAHAIVGRFDELQEAIAAADAYGDKWLATAAAGSPCGNERCHCEPIKFVESDGTIRSEGAVDGS